MSSSELQNIGREQACLGLDVRLDSSVELQLQRLWIRFPKSLFSLLALSAEIDVMTDEQASVSLQKRPPRFAELDSLRGVAALTVVFGHFSAAYLHNRPFSALLGKFPVRILLNGGEAVLLFFLLSGFVLSLPYRRRGVQYGPFLVRRTCRIYLPYLGALLLAVLGDWWLHGPIQPGTRWDPSVLSITWSNPPDARLILQHVLFIGEYNWGQYNPAFWSLVFEMRISLIFPFVAFAIMHVRTRWALLAALLLSLSTQMLASLFIPALARDPHSTVNPGYTYFQTLYFLAFFIFGAILAKHLDQVTGWYARLPHAGRVTLWVVSIFLYDAGFARHLFRLPQIADRLFFPGQGEELLTGAGGLLIILFAIQSAPFKRFLHHVTVHHIGKVSYSLYLVHGTVLFAMAHLWPKLDSIWLALAIYLGMTALITECFHRLVERPSMELGRRLTQTRPSAATVIT
jgi:peptidoglycan/LPS O-acetylase OafA/YrhL